MILKNMFDFHDFGACCWVLMILKKMLDFDDFGACCWIFDDFEEGAGF